MALPTTITGIDTAVACVGPYISSGGNVYFFGRDGTTATTLQAYKATDPTSSFSSVDTETGFGSTIRQIAGYQVGDKIHLVVGQHDGSVADYAYINFDMSSDLFADLGAIANGLNTNTSGGVNQFGCSIIVRSGTNGDGSAPAVVFFNGARVASMGNSYSQTYYSRRTGVSTWSAATQVSAGGTVDATLPEAVLGASDRVHFLWNASGGKERSLSSANSLDTQQSLVNLGTVQVSGISYNDGGTIRVQVTGNAGTQVYTERFDSGANPTINGTQISAAAGAGSGTPCRPFVDGTDVWALWANQSTNLKVDTSTDNGATWGTDTTAFTGTSFSLVNALLSHDGNIYQRGSDVVIPYVVNDNGTLKYNEYVIRTVAAPDPFKARETALPILRVPFLQARLDRNTALLETPPPQRPPIAAVDDLTPIGPQQFVRTWLQTPMFAEPVIVDYFPSRITARPFEPVSFQPARIDRNVALLSIRPVVGYTSLPPLGPQQFVRTWIQEALNTTGFRLLGFVLDLPPSGPAQFVRTWTQEPQITAEAQPVEGLTPLPSSGPDQFIRTWLQEPPPTEVVVEAIPITGVTALPPSGAQQPVRTWLQEPQLAEAPAPVADVTALPLRGPEQPTRTWLQEPPVAARVALRPTSEVTDLPSSGPPQFVRTWTQEPQQPEAVVSIPIAGVTALPPYGPAQFVRTWIQQSAPYATPEFMPMYVVSWDLPARRPTFMVADLQRNTALLAPVGDTPRNQYDWPNPRRAEYPLSLRSWTPPSVKIETIAFNTYRAPMFERPVWRQADVGRNAALLSTPARPPVAAVTALPRGHVYPDSLRFWGPNNSILRPFEQMPPLFLAHTVPRGHYYPDSLRSTIGIPGPGTFVPPVVTAFPHNIPFIATMGAMTAR